MPDERTPDGATCSAASFPPSEERRSNIDRRRTPDRRKSRDHEKNLKSDRSNTSNKEIEALFAELEMRVTAAIRQNEWRSKNDGSGWDKLIVPLPKDFPPHNRRYINRDIDEGTGHPSRRLELEPL